MRGDAHVRFGGRAGETDRQKSRHRAPVRPTNRMGRVYQVLKSQGMQANQQVTFLTDGGEDIRDLPCYLNAQAEHLLDWFHLTMRVTVMANMAKSLPPPRRSGVPADRQNISDAESATSCSG